MEERARKERLKKEKEELKEYRKQLVFKVCAQQHSVMDRITSSSLFSI